MQIKRKPPIEGAAMTNDQLKRLKSVKNWPKKAGKADYMKFLRGETLTRAEAIGATCYVCVCGEDTQPCIVHTCPLIDFCQWGKGKPLVNGFISCDSPCGGSQLTADRILGADE